MGDRRSRRGGIRERLYETDEGRLADEHELQA